MVQENCLECLENDSQSEWGVQASVDLQEINQIMVEIEESRQTPKLLSKSVTEKKMGVPFTNGRAAR